MSLKDLNTSLSSDASSRSLASKNTPTRLFKMDDLNFNKDWDYTLPTIVTNNKEQLKNSLLHSNKQFISLFTKRYSVYLSKLNFDNVLIAGGCVSSTLLDKNNDNDIDIFIYGLNVKQANEKLNTIVKQIYDSYFAVMEENMTRKLKQEKDEEGLTKDELDALRDQTNITVVRNNRCLTLEFGKIEKRRPNKTKLARMVSSQEESSFHTPTPQVNLTQKLQIIFRVYRSKEEILLGFDLGSSAVGYDGTDVLFTGLGKLSYEYLINVVDPSRRSTTYERRLVKYYNRGFQIVLRNLDIKKLPSDNLKYHIEEVCELPYFVFAYNDLKGNRITMSRTLRIGDEKQPFTDNSTSDYQEGNTDESTFFYINLRSIIKGTNDIYYYSTKLDPNSFSKTLPYITASRVIDFYDSLDRKILNKGTLDIKILRKYFTKERAVKLITILLEEGNKSNASNIINQQKEEVLEALSDLSESDSSEIKWITTNPGTQISGSFNPIISDPEDWYGKYYLETAEEKKSPSTVKAPSSPRGSRSFVEIKEEKIPSKQTNTKIYRR